MKCFKIFLKSSSKRLRKLRRTCSFFMFQVSPPSKFRKRMDQLRKNVLCGRKGFKKSRRRKMWRRQTFFVTIKAARNYKTKNIYIIFVIFLLISTKVKMCECAESRWKSLGQACQYGNVATTRKHHSSTFLTFSLFSD